MPIKFLLLGGVLGFFRRGGGGSASFIFYGRGDFSKDWESATLSFLSLFFGIPCFFPCEKFLVFLSVFPFFSRDLGASAGIKNPGFFGGFPCLFPKNQGKEGQGKYRKKGRSRD